MTLECIARMSGHLASVVYLDLLSFVLDLRLGALNP